MAGSADQEVVLRLLADFSDAQDKAEEFSSSFSKVFADLSSSAEDGFSGIEDRAAESADTLKQHGEEAGRGFVSGLLLAFAAASGAFLESVRRTFEQVGEYAESLNTLKSLTGDSAQSLEKFQYALVSQGVPLERAQVALTQLGRAVEEAAQKSHDTTSVFYQLGISAKSLVGKDTITQIEVLADRISNLKTHTEQVAATTELFGTRNASLLPILLQGADGIRSLMAAAGQQIPDATIASFERYHTAVSLLGIDIRNLYAALIQPLADKITDIANAVDHFIKSLQGTTALHALTYSIASISTALVGLMTGLAVVGQFFAEGFIKREIIDATRDFAGQLVLLTAVVGLVATAFSTNFGGARQILTKFFADVQSKAETFRAMWVAIVADFQSTVGPAIKQVALAFHDLLLSITGQVDALVQSQDTYDAIQTAAHDLFVVISTLVSWFANLLSAINDLRGPLEGLLVFIAIRGAALALTDGIIGLASALMLRLAPALTFLTSITDLFAATLTGTLTLETAVTGGLNLAIVALVLGLGYWITHMEEVNDWLGRVGNAIAGTFLGVLGSLEAALAIIVSAFADILEIIGKVIPGFSQLGDAAQTAADKISAQAQALRDLAAAHRDAASGPGIDRGASSSGSWGGYSGIDKANSSSGSWGGSKGKVPLNPPITGGLSATEQFLAPLKQKIEDSKEAVADLEFAITSLADKLKALGSIDSMDKAVTAQRLYNQELLATAEHQSAENGTLKTIKDAEAAIVNEMRGYSSTSKEHLELQRALNQLKTEEHSVNLKIAADYVRFTELAKGKNEAEKSATEVTSKDENQSWNARISAAQTYLTYTQQVYGNKEQELAASKALLDIDVARAKQADELASAAIDTKITALKGQQSAAKATTAGSSQNAADDEVAAQAKAVAEALTALNIAALNTQKAEIAEAAAQSELTRLQSQAKVDSQTLNAAQERLTQATNTATQAKDAERVASIQYKQAQEQTLQSVQQTRDAFNKLYQQIGGPLYSIIQGLATSDLPMLSNGLIALFQQSKSFTDIMKAMSQITTQLSKVFDLFRPVVDLLLGVVIGIVDVFLELYNIMAAFLSIFGIFIQRINLLNSNLNNLNNSVEPLIDITHNLPTTNQYNAGAWGALQGISNWEAAQNDANNDILQHFDASTAKLGEILGILIAIRVLMAVLAGNSFSSMFGGGGVGGILQSIGKLFGIGGGGGAGGGIGDVAPFSDIDAVPGVDSIPSVGLDALNDSDIATTTAATAASTAQVATTLTTASSTLTQVAANTASMADDFDAAMNVGEGSASAASGAGGIANAGGASGLFGTGGIGAFLGQPIGSIGGSALGTIGSVGLGAAGGGLLGSIIGPLMGNGKNDASIGGALGGAAGAAFGTAISGILGISTGGLGFLIAPLITSVMGSLVGGLFGSHDNPAEMPDKYNTGTYFTDMADLLGAGTPQYGANVSAANMNSSFVPGGSIGGADNDPTNSGITSLIGNTSFISFIEQQLAQYAQPGTTQMGANTPSYLQPIWNQLVSAFGISSTGAGQLNIGVNGSGKDDDLLNIIGATGASSSQINYQQYAQLMQQVLTGYQGSGALGGGLNGSGIAGYGAGGFDVSTLYGTNGTVTAPGTTNSLATQGLVMQPGSVQVTIESVYGTDPGTLKATIGPIVNDAVTQAMSRAQALYTRSNNSAFGRF